MFTEMQSLLPPPPLLLPFPLSISPAATTLHPTSPAALRALILC